MWTLTKDIKCYDNLKYRLSAHFSMNLPFFIFSVTIKKGKEAQGAVLGLSTKKENYAYLNSCKDNFMWTGLAREARGPDIRKFEGLFQVYIVLPSEVCTLRPLPSTPSSPTQSTPSHPPPTPKFYPAHFSPNCPVWVFSRIISHPALWSGRPATKRHWDVCVYVYVPLQQQHIHLFS